MSPEYAGVSRRRVIAGTVFSVLVAAVGLEAATALTAQATPTWRHPFTTRGTVSSLFGMRTNPLPPYEQKMHYGLDYSPPGAGTPIYAVAAGVCQNVSFNSGGLGHNALIEHDSGYTSTYGHMQSAPSISEGSTVLASQLVGYLGTTGASTGAHLHIEIALNGTRIDPLPLINAAPLAAPDAPPTNRYGDAEMMILRYGTGPVVSSPPTTFALFGPGLWYEWAEASPWTVANAMLAQIAPPAGVGAIPVSPTDWNLIKAAATATQKVQVVP